MKISRKLSEVGKQVTTGCCVLALLPCGYGNPPADDCCGEPSQPVKVAEPASPASVSRAASPVYVKQPELRVKVNRTLPKVGSPRAALEFSANPTLEELFRARIFEEPLVPVGGVPTAAENAALAAALRGYAKRTGPDDFTSLTGFLEKHPKSPWRAALLTNLGLEYYNTAHYSLTIPAWSEAWDLAKNVPHASCKAIADRAVGELAYIFARLGRMGELDALLKSVKGRIFTGPATERISGAREGLWSMQNEPGLAFRCGPFALHQIKLSVDPQNPGSDLIFASISTQDGFSLPQVVGLSQKLGLNYQMAFREKGAAVVVPCVIHWKAGHYAAIVGQEGDRYLVQDPTFRNDAWVTKEALETEGSGYFVIPPGHLPPKWRAVEADEGGSVWGKGIVGGPDPGGGGGPPNPPTPCKGMAVPSVDLLFVSLGLSDEPVGYSPPVGPSVRFMVRYNQRDASQPASFSYSNFGAKWTFDWLAYIKDDPSNPSAGVQYYRMGGFIRNFTGFNSNTQTYALNPLDLTKLTRTSATSYQMVSADGSKLIFSQSDGSSGTSRKIFLKQIIDPAGNAVTLTYDVNLRIVAVSDAIGQVSTLSYQHPTDIYKITKVTDPFGRFATFDYDASNRLTKITDVIGLTSQFVYEGASDFINALVTPYGTTAFTKGESGTTRSLETLYPDGQRERVEFNQDSHPGVPGSDPAASVPTGVLTTNGSQAYRNTYFWSKSALAASSGDYSKARIYHWLHSNGAGRVLESEKDPLEGRIWYDYPGQTLSIIIGTINKPAHVGRVLDDGTTQLSTYEYNDFGNVTKMVDPVGRTFSYLYAANGQDLLETRMTRNGAHELLSKATYDAQHLPLTVTDAAGQTTTYTYTTRGQLRTVTNPKNEVTTYSYDARGYLTSVNGPLPGPGDSSTWTYDVVGRVRTRTDENGYTLTFDYDALDRLTKIAYPDGTYDQYTYTRLDSTQVRDRANRITSFDYDGIRNMTKQTDALNRITLFQWCKCGDLRSVTDPMGRMTSWSHDIQGRVTKKTFADGSAISYRYENTTSRLRQKIDEKLQVTQYAYASDDNVSTIHYANASIFTPGVAFTYDGDYERLTSMTDGTGTTLYAYLPIGPGVLLGAGELATVDGPLSNDTITFAYDRLGRRVSTAIDGAASTVTFDPAGRVTGATNALGTFFYDYDGASGRLISQTYPNGQSSFFEYLNNFNERQLARITHSRGGATISEFLYSHDFARNRMTTWSQQAGAAMPLAYALGYNGENELMAATGSQGSTVVKSFNYTYDPAQNRVSEQVDVGDVKPVWYNALNEISTVSGSASPAATYEWDAAQRLTAVGWGDQRTEFTYDGFDRRVGIRELTDNTETSYRRFVWCGSEICEERDAAGGLMKRFFSQGVKVEAGVSVGEYFYTKDHLGSIRELVDNAGTVRARYAYELYGTRTKVEGDLDADFGFTGYFHHEGTGLDLPLYRAYDPGLGRWLSREPYPDAEFLLGPNLYTYARNDPVNYVDPDGRSWAAALIGGAAGAAIGIGVYLLLEDTIFPSPPPPAPAPKIPREPATPRAPLIIDHPPTAPDKTPPTPPPAPKPPTPRRPTPKKPKKPVLKCKVKPETSGIPSTRD